VSSQSPPDVNRSAVLPDLTPPQLEAWDVLLDLYEARRSDWTLLGGQMTWITAIEHHREPPRTTVDMDVLVDVRARPGMTQWLARWLGERGFDLAGISAAGIGHRFIRATSTVGGGQVMVDILAPEGLGQRINITTRPPARTVQVPGSNQALARTSPVTITSPTGRTGAALVPDLLGALIAKAAALTIHIRDDPSRDLTDAAFLLTCMDDPDAWKPHITAGDQRRLGRLRPLLDRDHDAWRPIRTTRGTGGGPRVRTGTRALQILLTPRSQWKPAE
jgi:hypothetical protein